MSDFKDENRLKFKKNIFETTKVEGTDVEERVKTGEVTESYRFTEE